MNVRQVGGAAESPVFKFAPRTAFRAELNARVDEHFARVRRSPRGGWRVYTKTAFIIGWFVAAYALLVFFAATWWQVALCALALGLAVAAIGFNIQHDGNHGGFSNHRWLNRLMALTLDAVGGSSYFWRIKHNVFHHSYTNLPGGDEDINMGPLGRLSPAQKRRWFHRFQQYYVWPLYAWLAIKWHLVDDFVQLATGRMGRRRIPRPRKWDLVGVCAGKGWFFAVAFVVPALLHPLWMVLVVYGATMLMVGFLLAVIFQMAHSVEEAEHPAPPEAGLRVPVEWAAHQVQTTVDFARDNRLLTWFVGGLNFQVEHHLFPRISHTHYPAIAPIVEEVAARHGVRYVAHRSFAAALRSHYRFLREMGRADASPA